VALYELERLVEHKGAEAPLRGGACRLMADII